MKQSCLMAFGMLVAVGVNAADTSRFLYAINNNGSISGFAIDPESGALNPLAGSPFASGESSPSCAALDPNGRFLYTADTDHGRVAVLRINPKSGALAGSPYHIVHPDSLAVDSTGRFAFIGHSESIATFFVDALSGRLTPAGRLAEAGASKQLAAHPSLPFLFAANGTLFVFAIDPANGSLTEVQEAFGATYFAMAAEGGIFYGRNEGTIAGYNFDGTTGTFAPSGEPLDSPNIGPAAAARSGRFVYDLDSSTGNVHGYLTDAATGALLSEVPGSPFRAERDPSALITERSGKFLYAGNTGASSISAYLADDSSGRLTRLAGSPFVTAGAPIALAAVTPGKALAPLSAIQVTPADGNIIFPETHKTVRFNAVAQFADGTTGFITSSVRWSSSDTSVAVIANKPHRAGLATAKGYGTATITAALGNVLGSTTMTVSAPEVMSIAVTPSDATINPGTTIQFTATGTYSDGTRQDVTKQATWSSSDGTVAVVKRAGVIHAVAPGSAMVSAAVGGVSNSATLMVQ